MANPVYNPQRGKGVPGIHYLWGIGVTAGIFILLPFTQFISDPGGEKELTAVQEFNEPPPVLPPPPDEPEEEEEEEEENPELEEPPQQIDLTDLIVSLNAGTGGFGANTGLVNFDAIGPSMDEMIFDVKDLDRVPRVIKRGRIEYPFELKRERIEGYVKLKVIIDERGRIRVDEVLEASHRAFVKSAVDAAEDSVFEAPTRNGKKVKAFYVLPFNFSIR